MDYYAGELEALKRAGRYRERRIYGPEVVDLASNDYLGLAENPQLLQKAMAYLQDAPVHAPKAAMLVNGYHPVHRHFEQALCSANGFENGIVMGSGFSANIAMIETLVRRGDALFLDEKYHASGMLAARLVEGEVRTFAHNDVSQLQRQLASASAKRRIIAVEGIYSMDGDLMHPEIFELAERYDAILIVDEAHSSGVVGPNLLGVFDHFNIVPRPNHIKMGTLGKAYGSFGAYVLASAHIVDYLLNRAKPVIYATAPSLVDTALAHVSFDYIRENTASIKAAIDHRRQSARALLGLEMDGLIGTIPVGDNREVMRLQAKLLEHGILIGAIRQPTVARAILRVIFRLGVTQERIAEACRLLQGLK